MQTDRVDPDRRPGRHLLRAPRRRRRDRPSGRAFHDGSAGFRRHRGPPGRRFERDRGTRTNA